MLVLAMGNENPLAQKDVITLDDLKKQKLILRLNSSGTRVLFEETLKAHNETIDNFNVMLEVNSIGTIMFSFYVRTSADRIGINGICIDVCQFY